MSSALNHLTKALTCRAIGPADDGEGHYTITTSGPNLTQYLTTDDGDSGLEEIVAYDVRADTPAVYLARDDVVRMVFYLNATNQLAFSFSEDGEWEEGELDGLSQPVVVHPQTQLSGLVNGDQIWVFFQTPAGHLAAVVQQMGQWSLTGSISADMAPRAPHMALADSADPNHVHVFYLTNRNEICYTQGSFTTSHWRSKFIFPTGCPPLIPSIHAKGDLPNYPPANPPGQSSDSHVHGAHFDGPISRFLVIPSEHPGRFTVYAATAASKLIEISHEGALTELGTIEGGRLVLPTRAESTLIININFLSFGRWVLGSLLGLETDEEGGGKIGKGSGYDC